MEKQAVGFHTPGLIDITAITTFGVNVKEGESPIGYFGTGFKYAMAVILRNGGHVELFRGNDRYVFGTQQQNIRGTDFDVVFLTTPEHEQYQLGFTTEVGKNWEAWMAYRELYCNTVDEGGETFLSNEATAPLRNDECTQILVTEWPEFLSVHREARNYFIPDDAPRIFRGAEIEILPGKSNYVFYKGIRVYDLSVESKYTYNITADRRLTEDRTLKGTWEMMNTGLPTLLCHECPNREIVQSVVTAEKDCAEGFFEYTFAGVPSPTFMNIVGELYFTKPKELNESAIKKYKAHVKVPPPKEVQLNDIDKQRLQKAIEFCNRLEYTIEDYPVIVVETLGEGIYAQADKGLNRILLTKQVFAQGTKVLANTLIEEWVHLKHDLKDETRALQTWLFEQIVHIGERAVGEAL